MISELEANPGKSGEFLPLVLPPSGEWLLDRSQDPDFLELGVGGREAVNAFLKFFYNPRTFEKDADISGLFKDMEPKDVNGGLFISTKVLLEQYYAHLGQIFSDSSKSNEKNMKSSLIRLRALNFILNQSRDNRVKNRVPFTAKNEIRALQGVVLNAFSETAETAVQVIEAEDYDEQTLVNFIRLNKYVAALNNVRLETNWLS